MSRDTTVIALRQPETIDDPLSELAREGARRMLAQVLIAEADSFVAMWRDLKLPDGRDRIVRHGHGPHRAIQTGSGLSRSVAPRCATGATWAQRRKSASPRRSCRSGRGGREESRCAIAGSLPAWGIDRRLPGGAHRPPGQGRAEPLAGRDHATDGGVAGGL
jgi:hypothetical protein